MCGRMYRHMAMRNWLWQVDNAGMYLYPTHYMHIMLACTRIIMAAIGDSGSLFEVQWHCTSFLEQCCTSIDTWALAAEGVNSILLPHA